jgi:glutathione S-transferase
MKLLIGNKNYSSWSFRPWLVLKQAEIPFEEELISFNDPEFPIRVRRVSPSGRVPALVDGSLVVWDSLAIVEYLAEKFPDRQLWPAEAGARAVARSLCAEMHSGFQLLRSALPMNFQVRLPGAGWSVKVDREIDRIVTMWQDTRARFGAGGPLLFGRFSIADAFFAPVVPRFAAYAVKLPPAAQAYADAVAALPAYQEWAAAARAENDFFAPDEPYRFAPDRPPGRQGTS